MSVTDIKTFYETVSYHNADGWTIVREWGTHPVSKEPLSGKWVLRNKEHEFIDVDAFRNDLAERNNFGLFS